MEIDIEKISKGLKKEIPFQWKIQSTPKEWKTESNSTKKGTCVAYIDARDVMDLLDEVVGPGNWQSDFYQVKSTMFCKLGIFINGNWIYKSDAGSPPDENSGEDAVIKGEPSDAFKRAAVQWGIGRFLYSKEIVWISQSDYNANKYKLTEFCNKGKKFANKQDNGLTFQDYIDSIRMEKDINHIRTLFIQCDDSLDLTESQLDMLKSEARKRTDFLEGSAKNNVLPNHI